MLLKVAAAGGLDSGERLDLKFREPVDLGRGGSSWRFITGGGGRQEGSRSGG